MKINKNIIKELSDYLKEFNLTEIEITEKDCAIIWGEQYPRLSQAAH